MADPSISPTPVSPTIRAPLDESLSCPASRDYSRAYLHHLVKSGEILGQVLLSWHNVAFFQDLMARIRDAIRQGRSLAALRRHIARRQRRLTAPGKEVSGYRL